MAAIVVTIIAGLGLAFVSVSLDYFLPDDFAYAWELHAGLLAIGVILVLLPLIWIVWQARGNSQGSLGTEPEVWTPLNYQITSRQKILKRRKELVAVIIFVLILQSMLVIGENYYPPAEVFATSIMMLIFFSAIGMSIYQGYLKIKYMLRRRRWKRLS